MRIVSTQTDADILRKKADADAAAALRALAANILRCCAGSGKDHLLERQCADLLEARQAQREAHGSAVPMNAPHHLSAAVSLEHHRDWIEDGSYAQCPIADAGMQRHAAYLLDQLTHVSLANRRMREAIIADGYRRMHPKP